LRIIGFLLHLKEDKRVEGLVAIQEKALSPDEGITH